MLVYAIPLAKNRLGSDASLSNVSSLERKNSRLEISTGAEGVAAMGVDTFPGLLSGNTKFTSTDTMPV